MEKIFLNRSLAKFYQLLICCKQKSKKTKKQKNKNSSPARGEVARSAKGVGEKTNL